MIVLYLYFIGIFNLSLFGNFDLNAINKLRYRFLPLALADYGEQCEDSPDEEDNDMMNCIGNRPPLFTRSIEFSNTRGACATQTDMMICYSCLPG